LKPLNGRMSGTSTQSKVQDNKGKNKGLNYFRSRWTHFVNRYVLPGTTKWVYVDRDLQEEKEKADIEMVRVQTQAAAIKDVGIINAQQALQKLVDEDVYPKEFLAQPDMTAHTALGDDEQSEELDVVTPEAQAVQAALRPVQQAVAPPAQQVAQ